MVRSMRKLENAVAYGMVVLAVGACDGGLGPNGPEPPELRLSECAEIADLHFSGTLTPGVPCGARVWDCPLAEQNERYAVLSQYPNGWDSQPAYLKFTRCLEALEVDRPPHPMR